MFLGEWRTTTLAIDMVNGVCNSHLPIVMHEEKKVYVTLRRYAVLAWMHDNRELVYHVIVWNNTKSTLQQLQRLE
jgi:hypothetical protein